MRHYVSPRNRAFWEAGQISMPICQRALITTRAEATADRTKVTCTGCNDAMMRRDTQRGAAAPYRAETRKTTRQEASR